MTEPGRVRRRPTAMRTLLLMAAVGGLLLLSPRAAGASCAAPEGTVPEQLAGAEAVFVGTVVRTPGDDRIAQVEVEEIWHGDVAHRVTVRGSEAAGQRNADTSVDRRYREGARYLFAVGGRGARFDDNACTPTRLWDPALAAHRPADATLVVPATPPATAWPPGLVGWALGLALALVAATALVGLGRSR